MLFAEVTLFPRQASTAAAEVDELFYFILAVAVFFSVLIAALLIYFAIRYRRRSEDFVPEPIVGSARLEVAWMVGPLHLRLVRGDAAGDVQPLLRRVLRHRPLADAGHHRGDGARGVPALAGRACRRVDGRRGQQTVPALPVRRLPQRRLPGAGAA